MDSCEGLPLPSVQCDDEIAQSCALDELFLEGVEESVIFQCGWGDGGEGEWSQLQIRIVGGGE